MTIKSSKTNTDILLFTFFMLTILAILLFVDSGNIYLPLFLISSIFFLLIPQYIALGRTFIMDENGCTVKFMKYSHTYRWNELKIKRIENGESHYGLKRAFYHYSASVIFSPKKDRKPLWLMPHDYSVMRPLTFIFVYLKPENPPPKGTVVYSDIYAVDKDLFMSKMAEWNVELEYRR